MSLITHLKLVSFDIARNIIIMENNSNIVMLRNLLDEDTRRFTSAEIELENSLKGWVNEARSMQLKTVLYRYLDFVQQHVKRLEDFFEEEKINAISFQNRVMLAFIEDTNEKLANCTQVEVKDACLLASIQSINHFKISVYGTASAFARALDLEKAAVLFHELEINEKHIDDRLSQLADFEINVKAIAPIALHQ
jgi:ferritin-like metal-binding protein YciE